MGWSSGLNYEGREVGYSHPSVCEELDCEEEIDLGLAYCCGGLGGVSGSQGCGHYFCYNHLFIVFDESIEQLCSSCTEKIGKVDED